MSEETYIAATESGIQYVTDAPPPSYVPEVISTLPTREDRGDSGYSGNLYEQDMWLTPTTKVDAVTLDPRPRWEIQEEQRIVEQYHQSQAYEPLQAGQAEAISTTLDGMSQLWDSPHFDAYLASDDESYQSVQLSPMLLAAVKKSYDVDSDTAKAFVHFHKLSGQQLQVLEQALTGSTSSIGYNPPSGQAAYVPQQDYSQDLQYYDTPAIDADPSYQDGFKTPQAEPNYDHELALTRSNYFPNATNEEFNHIIDRALSVFDTLRTYARVI